MVFVRLLSQGPIPLFREYNERLDGDPESEYQLEHKLTDAIAKVEEAGGPTLRLLDPTHDQIPDGDNLEDDPGSLNVPVNNPQRLAVVTLTQRYTHPGGRTLHYWGDQWWAWQNAAYTLVEPGAIEDAICRTAEDEFKRDLRDKLAAHHAWDPPPQSQ